MNAIIAILLSINYTRIARNYSTIKKNDIVYADAILMQTLIYCRKNNNCTLGRPLNAGLFIMNYDNI